LLQETHGSSDFVIHVGGHFYAKTNAFKIIIKGYYWPSIFQDSYNFSIYCDKCQKFVGKERLSSMPLQPILPDFPFLKWGLDFIGPINPPSSAGKVFILKTTYYLNFTKWKLKFSHLNINKMNMLFISLKLIFSPDLALL
jgi:hypothetical protein